LFRSEDELDRVHVEFLTVVHGVEEEALLERRERQYVAQPARRARRPGSLPLCGRAHPSSPHSCVNSFSNSSISSWPSPSTSSRSERVKPPASGQIGRAH